MAKLLHFDVIVLLCGAIDFFNGDFRLHYCKCLLTDVTFTGLAVFVGFTNDLFNLQTRAAKQLHYSASPDRWFLLCECVTCPGGDACQQVCIGTATSNTALVS